MRFKDLKKKKKLWTRNYEGKYFKPNRAGVMESENRWKENVKDKYGILQRRELICATPLMASSHRNGFYKADFPQSIS